MVRDRPSATAGNQPDRHQPRVFMALSDNQNLFSTSLSTTYHGSSVPSLVPRYPDLYADRECDTSAPGAHHFIAIDGNDFARLRREITAQNSRNLRSPMKQMPVESFFFA